MRDFAYEQAMALLENTRITISLFFNYADIKVDGIGSDTIVMQGQHGGGCIDPPTGRLVEYIYGPEMQF